MLPLLLVLIACSYRPAEDPSEWYDPGEELDVQEELTFTTDMYDFPADDADGIGYLLDNLFPVSSGAPGGDQVAWGAEDAYVDPGDPTPVYRQTGCQILEVDELPRTMEVVITAHPRFYYKTSGCDWDSDEKYYGSFFMQDRTGAIFVLGDTKVAHFDMGDQVLIEARAAKTTFGLDMIYSYDFVEIIERSVPIYYESKSGSFTAADIGRMWRVQGEVVVEKDTFGEFWIEDDAGTRYAVSLDIELNRRGLDYPLGTEIEVTGPLLYSFSTYSIVITKIGQITVLSD